MLIRRATEADAPAILALVPRLVSAFAPPPWREPAAMTATDLDVVAKAILSPGEDPSVFVAELDGAIAGFVHVCSLEDYYRCLLYTSPSPRDGLLSRMPSSA